MEIRNRVLFIGAPISSLGLALILGSSPAHAAQRYLCTSVPSACEYAGPDAPLLNANVCWNGSVARLRGSVPCPTGSWPYFVQHGWVDPWGIVQAYIALDDACDHGWCTVLPPGTVPPTDEGEVCCPLETSGGDCTLEVLDCVGEILWCESYEANEDGTVECTEFEE
jgi:hypothetical protein